MEPEKSDKQPEKKVEELGDVTQGKVYKPSKPKRQHKPWPGWIKKILAIVGLLIVAAASFYAGWKLMEEDKPAETAVSEYVPAEWVEARSEATIPRTEVSAALYKGLVYVVGGLDAAGATQNVVEIFDPEEDDWDMGEALPEAVHHTTAVAFDGNLYVVGGLSGSDFKPTASVQIFDGSAWASGPSLPEPIGAHGAAVLEGRLYVAGGVQANNESTAKVFSIGVGESAWREEEPMITARNHLTVAVAAGKLYAIGGRDSSTTTMNTVEVYDPGTKQWSPTLAMPTGRSGLTSTVLDNKIYVFGGESNDKTFNEAEEFDPESRSWTTLQPMREPRHGLGSATFNNTIYIFLGGPTPGLSVSDNVQILNFTAE